MKGVETLRFSDREMLSILDTFRPSRPLALGITSNPLHVFVTTPYIGVNEWKTETMEEFAAEKQHKHLGFQDRKRPH